MLIVGLSTPIKHEADVARLGGQPQACGADEAQLPRRLEAIVPEAVVEEGGRGAVSVRPAREKTKGRW